MTTTPETLKRTPLHDVHVALGAKMVPFAGFEMPVTYPSGINAEHKTVRESVGVFDVSHMGEFDITGPDRHAFVQSVTCRDGAARQHARDQCSGTRTGYTGEDGFELYCRAADAEKLWHALVGAGRAEPVGLGARDTLRLEAGLPLYGNDIDDTTTPYEAGLAFIVKLDKGSPFTGQEALKRQKLEGVKRRLVGFKMSEPKSVARHGYPVFLDGTQVDIVRSGTVTPTVNAAIGTTYLPSERAKPGTKIEVDIRGKRVAAEALKMPFVPHRTKR